MDAILAELYSQLCVLAHICQWRILIHPPLLKSPAPSLCEARAGRGLGRGARSIELSRSFEIPALPGPLPTSPSWGEGIDRGLGAGIKTRPLPGGRTKKDCRWVGIPAIFRF